MKLLAVMVVIGTSRLAAADALALDGEAIFGWPGAVWAGVTLHDEHRVATTTGVTARGSVARGEYLDTDLTERFTRLAAAVGVRHHVDRFYGELAVGVAAVREPVVDGVLFPVETGMRWRYAPTLEPALGVRLGHVEISAFFPIELSDLGANHLPGLRIGGVFDL